MLAFLNRVFFFATLYENFPTIFSTISVLRPFPLPLNLELGSARDTPSFQSGNIFHGPIRALCPTSPSYRIKLTVYSARRLPLSFNSRLCFFFRIFNIFRKVIYLFYRGEAVAPSTYLTVIGEDGRTLSSPVRSGTLHPEWNWTETFSVCNRFLQFIILYKD